MKFMLFVLPTVPATLEERERLRPIGRNNDRYQMMLDELRKLAVFADDAGFDVLSTTEHHFHSEGYECSVAPLMLYTDLAARTKRIRFSPLGLVLPSWDPSAAQRNSRCSTISPRAESTPGLPAATRTAGSTSSGSSIMSPVRRWMVPRSTTTIEVSTRRR